MNQWKNDDELFEMMRTTLYTAVVGDILDQLGYVHQFLPRQIRPLRDSYVLAGRAMPVVESDMATQAAQNTPGSFGMMMEALDSLQKNEVYLASGGSFDYAMVGELMCTRMKYLQAAGAVVNGCHRDTKGMLALDFPAFSCGAYAQDQGVRGKVTGYRVPIRVGEVMVHPGDIVMGDVDGVVVIPQEAEQEVIRLAYEKATGEKTVSQAIRSGMSTVEAFRTYGIL